ncbi:MAG: hypothetical protein K2O58_07540 [Bacteroidales bacterium]|nr:hypothetical protein [Bacteroidales bacterium]
MKKALSIAAVAALVAAAVSISVYVNSVKNEMDDLFYANVEALARGEGGGHAICYSSYIPSDNMRSLLCVTCDYVDGIGVVKGGYCKWK